MFRIATGTRGRRSRRSRTPLPFGTEQLGVLLLLKAFAGGSVALTGVEAIANGVPAFKPPEAKNAANTMTAMAVLLAVLFIGLTVFAVAFGLRPTEEGGPSVVALAARTAFGEGSPFFYAFAASTALILFLAANTSFNAFPRLAAILSEDGYMPRQFSFRGDRLAYSWGIVLLAAIAFVLLWAFGGDTHALIPLYSVGVFLCFTLSQLGMVKHWRRVRESGWRWRLAVNALGGVMTAVVLGIVVFEKFEAGALSRGDPRARARRDDAVHQAAVRADPPHELKVDPDLVVAPAPPRGAGRRPDLRARPGGRPGHQRRSLDRRRHPRRLHLRRPRRRRGASARRSSGRCPASRSSSWSRRIGRWRGRSSPISTCSTPAWPPDKPDPITFVVIPEYVARSWWERILYNQSAKRLRRELLGRRHTVVVNVPYRREDPDAEPPAVSPPSGSGSASALGS